MVDSYTRVVGLIGSPVSHSLSPAIHNAAFRELDMNWLYLPFDVEEGRVEGALHGMRSLGILGLNVTVPHKVRVRELLDRVSPEVEAVGAVNTVAFDGKHLVGHNTDVAGITQALRDDLKFDPAGQLCCVIGAGGAARAVVWSLLRSDAKRIAVLNRSGIRVTKLAEDFGDRVVSGTPDDVADAALVVNATSIGMAHRQGGEEWLAAVTDRMQPGQAAYDIVYTPERTPFLEAAEGRGATAMSGMGMLIYQAAASFRLFTGRDAPLETMRQAAENALNSPR